MKGNNNIYIAVLLTCFNRKDKTCACLNNLYLALDAYNSNDSKYPISLEVFLVDDGCTDGTADAIIAEFHDRDIHIIQGTGFLFWAGGMRLAWREAYKQHKKWDFYLLLNDDTDIFTDSFSLLMQTHEYSMAHYGRCGIYSGATCAKSNRELCTYGGDVWVSRFKAVSKRLSPSGTPQMCDIANANILLVPSGVVDEIGFFCEDYQHGYADYDYTMRARKSNIPVLLTPEYCGMCDNDHAKQQDEANRICAMSFAERRRYFNNPVHSSRDYLRFIYNTSPMRYPMVLVGRFLNLYCPRLYYKLHNMR